MLFRNVFVWTFLCLFLKEIETFASKLCCDACSEVSDCIKVKEKNGDKNYCPGCLCTEVLTKLSEFKAINTIGSNISEKFLKQNIGKDVICEFSKKKVSFWEEYERQKKRYEEFKNKGKKIEEFYCGHPDCENICTIKKGEKYVTCKNNHKNCSICKRIIKEDENINHNECKEEAVEEMIKYNEEVLNEINGKYSYLEIPKEKESLFSVLFIKEGEKYKEIPKEDFDKKEYEKLQKYERIENYIGGEKYYNNKGMKPCPECLTMIEKNSGCNQMTCECGHKWCWMCGANCFSENEA